MLPLLIAVAQTLTRRSCRHPPLAGTLLEKGVARSGLVGAGNYKYYKLTLSCVEAAQALTFTLSAINGNPDLFISQTLKNPTQAGLVTAGHTRPLHSYTQLSSCTKRMLSPHISWHHTQLLPQTSVTTHIVHHTQLSQRQAYVTTHSCHRAPYITHSCHHIQLPSFPHTRSPHTAVVGS
jgi:hypothetical protein